MTNADEQIVTGKDVSSSLSIVAFPAFRNRHSNPYTSLLYESMHPFVSEVTDYGHLKSMPKGVDIIHIHWPDLLIAGRNLPRAMLRSFGFLSRLMIEKWRGAKVIWTVHNLAPHDGGSAFLAVLFWPLFLHLLDGAIFLSKPAHDDAVHGFPQLSEIPHAIIPHGHYKPILAALPHATTRQEAREGLNLPQDRFIYLYFGQIRPYKNVEHLIEIYRTLGGDDTMLVVTGSCGSKVELKRRLHALAAGDSSIRLDLRHLLESELAAYLIACDLVVLPYRHVLNSGSIMMALSAQRPVLAPDIGSISDVSQHVGPNWVMTYENDMTFNVMHEAREKTSAARPSLDMSYFDWLGIARQTVDFYNQLVKRG